jgi:hypothetical protein
MTMLDDLREQASDPDFFADDDSFAYKDAKESKVNRQLFLGMTPIQRFVIAVMVLLMVCVMGSFMLLVTEKVFLPFI